MYAWLDKGAMSYIFQQCLLKSVIMINNSSNELLCIGFRIYEDNFQFGRK